MIKTTVECTCDLCKKIVPHHNLYTVTLPVEYIDDENMCLKMKTEKVDLCIWCANEVYEKIKWIDGLPKLVGGRK